MAAYYNEIDPAAAHVLRALVADGVIAPGDVDERSIEKVRPDDLKGYTQCHFFAGGALWSVAARLAGWPDDRPLWTGSCPCQPFSVAGKGAGTGDPRHLWPHFHRLIGACRPAVVVGEQVAGAAGYDWLDGVRSDLEREGYASRGVDIPACAVDAPHIRQRLYWVAQNLGIADSAGRNTRGAATTTARYGHTAITGGRSGSDVADADDAGRERRPIHAQCAGERSAWSEGVEWRRGADGKTRRVESGLCLLADGFPGRVGLLRIGGNAIVPQVAAEVLKALMEAL